MTTGLFLSFAMNQWGHHMNEQEIRRRCEQRLRDLPVVVPFDLDVFCARLGEGRGRPVHLHAMTAEQAGAASGMWVATNFADHIFHDSETSALHREHIVLHEIGHMVADHEPAPVLDGEDAAMLFPNLDGEVVARVLARTRYSRDDEREAELLATLISARAERRSAPGNDPAADALRDRLRSALS